MDEEVRILKAKKVCHAAHKKQSNGLNDASLLQKLEVVI